MNLQYKYHRTPTGRTPTGRINHKCVPLESLSVYGTVDLLNQWEYVTIRGNPTDESKDDWVTFMLDRQTVKNLIVQLSQCLDEIPSQAKII